MRTICLYRKDPEIRANVQQSTAWNTHISQTRKAGESIVIYAMTIQKTYHNVIGFFRVK